MNDQDKSKLRASLIGAIDTWCDMEQNSVELPWIGDHTVAHIADAAMSVILALDDSQEYIKREGVFEEPAR